jgi:hypothetical protein
MNVIVHLDSWGIGQQSPTVYLAASGAWQASDEAVLARSFVCRQTGTDPVMQCVDG